MKLNILQFISSVAVLAGLLFWSETEAKSTLQRTSNSTGSVCYNHQCGTGRQCIVDLYNEPLCVCNTSCSDVDHRQVCGSDGVTYRNLCQLNVEACVTSRNITMIRNGECIYETVCKGVTCPNGRRCAVDELQQPVCVCIDVCPSMMDTVCGSDNRTYGNECELQREACYTQKSIRVVNKGFCLQGSVCHGHQCPTGKQCVVDLNKEALCVCNTSCPDDDSPVCGSDGVTYVNLCQLKVQACTTATNITMIRTGECIYDRLCIGVVCPSPKTCIVDVNNQTSCGCLNCTNFYYPVCGSDNKTYDNYCQMNSAFCQANKNITTYYVGFCSEGANCEGMICPTGQHCDSQHQSKPKCVCDTICPMTYSPVCGSNNKTYNNTCELQKDACLTNTSITILFDRRCEEVGCRYTSCSYGQTCVVDERYRPRCVCSELYCYVGSTEVCGTGNKTYSNDCFLTVASCIANETISLKHTGPCKEKASACDKISCLPDKKCGVDERNRPTCVCFDQCISVQDPVCGSDGYTYDNECELQRMNCLSKKTYVTLTYRGKCDQGLTCRGITCPTGQICALTEENQPTCACNTDCSSALPIPVCGTDGKTYDNSCYLDRIACTTDKNIKVDYSGQCNDDGNALASTPKRCIGPRCG